MDQDFDGSISSNERGLRAMGQLKADQSPRHERFCWNPLLKCRRAAWVRAELPASQRP